MVTSATGFGRNGVQDWLMQRATAVVLLAYFLFIIIYLLNNPDLTYQQWSGLFEATWVRIFSLLALLSICLHSWIGLWSVSTDYIKPMGWRVLFQFVCGLMAFSFMAWGIQVLWGL